MQNMQCKFKNYVIHFFFSTHLGGCCDGSISSQVETPLSKPHHGLVAPVFGLSDVLIYLLQQPVAMIQMGEKKNVAKSGREKSEAEEERQFNMNVKSRL